MHVMMTKEQFDVLKQKAKGGGSKDGEEKDKDSKDKGSEASQKAEGGKDKGNEKLPKVTMKEEDDTHGTVETDDFVMGYFYNPAEGRLYFGPVSKRKSLAAYCASDNICSTFVMDILSAMPNPEKKSNGGDKSGTKGGDGESQEKKDQSQHQNQYGTANEQNQPSQ